MSKNDIGNLANNVYQLLKDLESPEECRKVLHAASILLDESPPTKQISTYTQSIVPTNDVSREPSFSNRSDISPKQFLHEKEPKTDVEKVACLAYYLSHFLDQPHFNTIDISSLNTDAAQIKFSNPAQSVSNATRRGLITSGEKGTKQISAIGEKYVDALPDKVAANRVIKKKRKRGTKKSKRKSKKKVSSKSS